MSAFSKSYSKPPVGRFVYFVAPVRIYLADPESASHTLKPDSKILWNSSTTQSPTRKLQEKVMSRKHQYHGQIAIIIRRIVEHCAERASFHRYQNIFSGFSFCCIWISLPLVRGLSFVEPPKRCTAY